MLRGASVSQMSGAVVGARVNIVRGRETLGLGIPVRNVVLEGNSEQVVPLRLKFEAPRELVPEVALDLLNNYGQRVQLFQTVTTAQGRQIDAQLGWFQITDWSEDTSAISVTAVDLLQLLEDNPMAWPSSPPKNQTLRMELQRLAGSFLPVTVTEGGTEIVPRSMEWGTSRSEAIRDLAVAYGLYYAVDLNGYLRFRPYRQAPERSVIYRDSVTPIEAPRKARPRIPNNVIAVGKGDIFKRYDKQRVYSSVPEDMYSNPSSSGWEGRSTYARWHFAGSGPLTAVAMWRVNEDTSQTGFGVQLEKKIAKAGAQTIRVTCKASRNMPIQFGRLDSDNQIVGAQSGTISGSDYKTFTTTVADGTQSPGWRLYTSEAVRDGDYIELSVVTINQVKKGISKRIYNQRFNDQKRDGWTAISGGAKQDLGNRGSGKFLRWTMYALSQSAARARPRLVFRQKVEAGSDKTIRVAVRSSRGMNWRFTVLGRGGKELYRETQNVEGWTDFTAGVLWEEVTGFNLTPLSNLRQGDWFGVDNTWIDDSVPVYVEKAFVGRAKLAEVPYDSAYGPVTERVELESVKSQNEAAAAANRIMSENVIANQTRSIEMMPDARLQLGDVAGFVVDGEVFTGRVTAFSLPISEPGMERVDLEVLQW